jgi:hypothetical protein
MTSQTDFLFFHKIRVIQIKRKEKKRNKFELKNTQRNVLGTRSYVIVETFRKSFSEGQLLHIIFILV